MNLREEDQYGWRLLTKVGSAAMPVGTRWGQPTVTEMSMDFAARAPGLKSQFCPLLANDLGQMILPLYAPVSSSVK